MAKGSVVSLQRVFDVIGSTIALLVFGLFIAMALALVYLGDRKNPLYISKRIGVDGVAFDMYKIRTMVVNAEKSQMDSTKMDDPRITKIGSIIRRSKLDEFLQFINVLIGDMSIVGPRPNVQREINIYTEAERSLLLVKPGVTDLSSIVFFDLAVILQKSADANIAYNQLVRPWKSRLGLLYIQNKSIALDIYIVFLTALSFVWRRGAINLCTNLVRRLGGDEALLETCKRTKALHPYPPPGATEIVRSRDPAQQT